MRGVRPGWAAVGAIGAVVLSGCSSEPADNVATYQRGQIGIASTTGLQGTLVITPECVTVRVGDEVWTPAFGGLVEVDGDTLRMNDNDEFTSGEPIGLGGGEATAPGELVVPDGCPKDHLWVVITK